MKLHLPSYAALVGWARQPTTVAGLMSLAAGTCAGMLGAPMTEWCPLVCGGVVGLVFPDDSTRQATYGTLAVEVVEDVLSHRLAAGLPRILDDARAIARVPVSAVGEPGNAPERA